MYSIWCCQINPLVLAQSPPLFDTDSIPSIRPFRQHGGKHTKGTTMTTQSVEARKNVLALQIYEFMKSNYCDLRYGVKNNLPQDLNQALSLLWQEDTFAIGHPLYDWANYGVFHRFKSESGVELELMNRLRIDSVPIDPARPDHGKQLYVWCVFP